MKSRKRVALASVLIIGTSLFAGCGSDESASDKAAENLAEKAMEDAAKESGEDIDVDLDDDKVTVESEDGTVSMGGTERPESLPDDFPLVDGEITYAMDGPSGSMVTIKTDDAADAFDEALADLEAAGWTRASVTESVDGSMAMLSGEKEGDSVMITTVPDSEEITYTVSLM